ncbi:MAG: type 11 methyltransferase [Sphingomonas bacterium]|jgi:phospholipid N-methyltransferase|nr:methyltransferase [Sphingomonas bacterium]MDB5690874.1 type 11 methyltransferase [Sphingomonas bacterium]
MPASSAENALKRTDKSRRRDAKAGPLGMFFKEFLKHPVMVGSIIPSSGKLIEKMLSRVDWANTKVFVEYGPGVGTFCKPILDRMAPDATLIAIDTNADFVTYLRRRIVDSRFHAVEGSAADVRTILADLGFGHADYILSGLPFSTLPPGVGNVIAGETAAALRPGGAFLVYQFSPKVRDFIAPHFKRIDHGMEVVNIPPAQLYWGWKD